MILNMVLKGCSKLYKILKDQNDYILVKITDTWSLEIDLNIGSFDLSSSFNLHHSCYNNVYLKYILFRTLHNGFYTNKTLFYNGS